MKLNIFTRCSASSWLLKIFLLSVFAFQLISCRKGDDGPEGVEAIPIRFATSTSKVLESRAGDTKEALNNYIQDFTVYGVNGNLNGASFVKAYDVFPNYKVWYLEGTTVTNSDGWEYVGDIGNEANPDVQSIKYWDDNQDMHYFWAVGNYAKGGFLDSGAGGTATFTDGRVASIAFNGVDANAANGELIYFTDPVLVTKGAEGYSGEPVELVFKKLQSRVRFGFYEAIEEVSSTGDDFTVTELKFYGEGTEGDKDQYGFSKATTGDKLFVKGEFPTVGTVTIGYSYTDTGVGSASTSTVPGTSSVFLTLDNPPAVSKENPLSTSSVKPSYAKHGTGEGAEYLNVLPYENNPSGITIKCDYKIYNSFSDSEQSIVGKYATIPASYCQWKPNKSYTYIFKLSDSGLALYEVKVEDWLKGEEKNEEWHNW